MAKTGTTPRVAIVMGSDSDLGVMKGAVDSLSKLGVPHEMHILSAHRTPQEATDFARTARDRGIRVIIAGAGGAAHLAGALAAHTELPIIGVPVPIEPLNGYDSLLSTVQMPKGVPVATVAIGNSYNAGLLAAQILGAGLPEFGDDMLDKFAGFKQEMRQNVLAKQAKLKKPAK
jgi:phosphoribosylaminoimidazole carboxylase PurE protein